MAKADNSQLDNVKHTSAPNKGISGLLKKEQRNNNRKSRTAPYSVKNPRTGK